MFVDKKCKDPLFCRGFLQAGGVALYCALAGIIFWKGNDIFGRVPNYFGPVAFLLLFSLSALICGILVFYYPYLLFFDGKKKEAIDLVLFTTGWIFFFFMIFLSLGLILR